MKIEEIRMLDITDPGNIQIEWSANRKVLWVSIDGVCLLRASTSPKNEVGELFVSLEGFTESDVD